MHQNGNGSGVLQQLSPEELDGLLHRLQVEKREREERQQRMVEGPPQPSPQQQYSRFRDQHPGHGFEIERNPYPVYLLPDGARFAEDGVGGRHLMEPSADRQELLELRIQYLSLFIEHSEDDFRQREESLEQNMRYGSGDFEADLIRLQENIIAAKQMKADLEAEHAQLPGVIEQRRRAAEHQRQDEADRRSQAAEAAALGQRVAAIKQRIAEAVI